MYDVDKHTIGHKVGLFREMGGNLWDGTIADTTTLGLLKSRIAMIFG